MTAVQYLRGDLGNGCLAACHSHPHRVVLIHGLHELVVHFHVRVVQAHADFLGNDALLLGHALLCKIRRGDKTQQGAQVILKAPGTLKIVARDGRSGKGIVHCPVGGHDLQHVSLLGIKHLVLQEVGHPCRSIHPVPVLVVKAQVHATVAGGKKGELLGVFRPHIHQNLQAVFQAVAMDILAQQLIFPQFHVSPPPQ